MKIKLLHIANRFNSGVQYRRDILNNILLKDSRFEVTTINIDPFNITKTFDINQISRIIDNTDIIIFSSPHCISYGEDIICQYLSFERNINRIFIAYDLSDDWDSHHLIENNKKILNISNFVGCSAFYLNDIVKKLGISCKVYPNGIRSEDSSFSFTKNAKNGKAIYAGNIYKFNYLAHDRFCVKTRIKSDLFFTSIQDFNESNYSIDRRFTSIHKALSYKELKNILSSYSYGLILIEEIRKNGMLPDKFFDYCQAHIPTIYCNCNELKNNPDFQKVAFDLYDQDFNIGKIHPSDKDYEEICTKYDMRKNLARFIDDVYIYTYQGKKIGLNLKTEFGRARILLVFNIFSSIFILCELLSQKNVWSLVEYLPT